MSNQLEQSLTPQELRQALLAEIEASKQAIDGLSDEQLVAIAGGEGETPSPPAGEQPGSQGRHGWTAGQKWTTAGVGVGSFAAGGTAGWLAKARYVRP